MNDFVSYILACFIIEVSPGPNMAYLALLSAAKGRRAGFFAVCGIALGLFVIGIVVTLGISSFLLKSKATYILLRYIGVLYFLWLAWESWGEKLQNDSKIQNIFENVKFFWRGFLTNILNPKVMIFYAVIVPAFIDRTADIFNRAITLTVTYVVVATMVHCTIVSLAATMHGFFNDPGRFLITTRIMSLFLIAIAVWFAFEALKQ